MRLTKATTLFAAVLLLLLLPMFVHGFVHHPLSFSSSSRTTTTISRTSTTISTTTTRLHAAIIRPSANKLQIASLSGNFMRGKLMLVAHKIFVSPIKYKDIFMDRLLPNTYWPEVAFIVCMVNSVSISKWIFDKRKSHLFLVKDTDTSTNNNNTSTHVLQDDVAQQGRQRLQAAFEQSKSLKMARIVTQIGFLQAILYISDVCLVILKLLGFKFVEKHAAQHVAGSVIFSMWFARTLSQFKYYVLTHPTGFFSFATNIKHKKTLQQQQQQQQGSSSNKNSMSLPASELIDELDDDGTNTLATAQNNTSTTAAAATTATVNTQQPSTMSMSTSSNTMRVYNRFANQVLDVIIYFSCIVSVVDTLGIGHFGFALKSIFGLGSFGTLVLSLASKDVAAEFVGGLMVQSSNFVDEGEVVILQDGTKGSVAKIGWLHTYILKDDDFIVRVPNSQISHQRIARLKRDRGGGKRKIFYK